MSRRIIISLLIVMGVIAACGTSGGQPPVTDTITQQQAAQQVQDNIHTAAAQLPATAKLEQQLTNFTPCDDPTDNGPKGRVTAGSTYQIHELPAAQYPHYFDTLRTWWTQHDFHVLEDQNRGPQDMYLWVENTKDGFRMSLQSNPTGGLFMTSSSPCVWPNGKA
jgi:hypothetical protein